MMDVNAALRELRREWKRVNRLISRLEAQQRELDFKRPGRRGRTTMGKQERAEVSRRMKEYWNARLAKDKREPHDV